MAHLLHALGVRASGSLRFPVPALYAPLMQESQAGYETASESKASTDDFPRDERLRKGERGSLLKSSVMAGGAEWGKICESVLKGGMLLAACSCGVNVYLSTIFVVFPLEVRVESAHLNENVLSPLLKMTGMNGDIADFLAALGASFKGLEAKEELTIHGASLTFKPDSWAERVDFDGLEEINLSGSEVREIHDVRHPQDFVKQRVLLITTRGSLLFSLREEDAGTWAESVQGVDQNEKLANALQKACPKAMYYKTRE